MEPPILITGAARSGTSMVAGVINLCGAFGGHLSGPTEYNKKGMFENGVIRDRIVKPYLSSIGMDPMGQYPLPKRVGLPLDGYWTENVQQVMNDEGYSGGPWFYKGAKMCLVWPLWYNAFPEAKWVIVRRNRVDIINSCLRTRFMRAFDSATQWDVWVRHHVQCFNEMQRAIPYVREFWPNPHRLTPFESLVNCLGLKWNGDAVREFLDPAMFSSVRRGIAA